MTGRAGAAPAAYRDLVLYAIGAGDRADRFRLLNLLSQAVACGLVTSAARGGLGTAVPVGGSLAGESLYYQALRVLSYFDWELWRRLCRVTDSWPLPDSLAVLVGRFPAGFLDRFRDERIDAVVKSQRALAQLMPELRPFEFRRLGDDDFSILRSSRRISFAAPIREQLWRGTAAKLAAIAAGTYRADAVDVRTKLETMVGAYAPLATVFGAELDAEAPDKSYTRLTLYLPALHTLHADDVDDPTGWYLERGLPLISLPRPVQIRAAELTHLSYLSEAERDREQAISVEVRRDFAATGPVTITTRFGSLFREPDEELFGLDSQDHRDGLYVGFRPRLPASEQDSAAVRAVKEGFHRVFGGFEVEARIQELTLELHRSLEPEDPDAAAELLRPCFCLDRSRISFRAHRVTASAAERVSLKAAGFTCEADPSDPGRAHCYRDFWTWDRFAEFLSGRELGGGAGGLLAHSRERLVEQVVGLATKAVLDHSIPSIEDAIDDEIARVVGEHLDRYARAREVLTDRLHHGLF